MKQRLLKSLGGLAAGICLWSAASPAQAAVGLIDITLHTSRYMSMPTSITRLAVGDPAVATVVEIPGSDTEFLIVTHQAGTTSLFVWTDTGERFEYLIGVSPEDLGLAQVIERTINLPDVHVKMVEGKIMLTGTVENQYERNYAVRTAQLFAKNAAGKVGNMNVGSSVGTQMEAQSSLDQSKTRTVGGGESEETQSVIDLLHMAHPSQIRLEAQVIAITPEDEKNIGITYGSATGTVLTGSPGIFYMGESYGSGSSSSFGHNPWDWFRGHHDDINLAVRALVTQSKAKILSRPSITTMSGEEAVIQVGGEIPYTVRSSDGTPTTMFKDYGIILQFRPTVDAEGRIVSSIHTEVSMPSGESVDNQPILDRRRADSVVTVRSGSTMVIGGLMDSRDYKTVRKFPFLGNIPVIGEFFKYTSHTKDNQELIILVTPRLVDEEEASTTRMSDEMKKYYDKGRQQEANRQEVDLNEPLPEPEKIAEEAAQPQEDHSMLGKYLNREALPPSEGGK